MTDRERITEAMVQAAATVRLRQYASEYDATHLSWNDFADEAREILEAALPPAVASGWVWSGVCGATTDGSAYVGHPYTMVCVKRAGHRASHAAANGAMW
jgi:hypothetical protein